LESLLGITHAACYIVSQSADCNFLAICIFSYKGNSDFPWGAAAKKGIPKERNQQGSRPRPRAREAGNTSPKRLLSLRARRPLKRTPCSRLNKKL